MIKTTIILLAFMAILSVVEPLRVRPPKKGSRPPLKPLKMLHADQCEVVVRTDCLKKYRLPRGKRICAQIPEEKLLERLQKIGGWNPLYTAMNKTEAAKNFKDPRYFYSEKPPINKLPDRKKKCKKPTPRPRGRPVKKKSDEEGGRKKEERDDSMLLSFLDRKDKVSQDEKSSQTTSAVEDSESESEPEITVSKRAGSKTQNCWTKNSVVESSKSSSNQRHHLCGECHVITTLDDDVRPRLINEGVCKHGLPDDDPNKEQSGNTCSYNAGLCKQRVVHFPALRMTGYEIDQDLSDLFGANIYVETWAEFTKQVRGGCQCEIFQPHLLVLQKLISS